MREYPSAHATDFAHNQFLAAFVQFQFTPDFDGVTEIDAAEQQIILSREKLNRAGGVLKIRTISVRGQLRRARSDDASHGKHLPKVFATVVLPFFPGLTH